MSALTLYNSARGHSRWHTPGVLNILKWKRAVNIFTEFGQRRIIEKPSPSSFTLPDEDMFTPSIWLDTRIATPRDGERPRSFQEVVGSVRETWPPGSDVQSCAGLRPRARSPPRRAKGIRPVSASSQVRRQRSAMQSSGRVFGRRGYQA